MSCWVVPALAAELWHIPLEHLLRGIRDGLIPSHDEQGFTFVDVASTGPRPKPPPTFVLASEGERDGSPPPDEPADAVEPEEGFEDNTASKDLGDWRAARRKASRLRIPPPRRPSIN
jgi:hypothetical protein